MRKNSWWASKRRGLSAVLIAALASTGIVVLAAPASAEEPAGLLITKEASTDTVAPGDSFSYTIQVSCIYSGAQQPAGCTNANIMDEVPDSLTVDNVSVTLYADYVDNSAGQTVDIDFTSAFVDPVGGQGMLAGSTATVLVDVTVDDDFTYDDNGEELTNEAFFSADNPDTATASDEATVVVDVPLVLDTEVTKSFEPASGTAAEGTPTSVNIVAQNTSTVGVDSIVVTEPADPTASPNPFESLAFDSVVVEPFPDGADTVQIDLYTADGWVEGEPGPAGEVPAGVDPDDVLGVRVTYSSSDGTIDPGATANVGIDVTQRDLGDIDSDVVVPNTVGSEVSRDGETESDTGDADYTILGNVPDVVAGKSFDPTFVPHGGTSDATITAQNAWDDDVATLSIIEPAVEDGESVNDPGFDESMSFEGFAAAPVFPAGATSATVTYYYADGDPTEETVSFAPGDEVPEPSRPDDVVRFGIEFTGDIPAGSTATVVATIGTDPDNPATSTEIPNEVTAAATTDSGATGTDEASDSFISYLTHIESVADKSITPSTILGLAGEYVVVQLPGGPAPLPDDFTDPQSPYSTTGANTIVVQDPAPTSATNDTPQSSEFWDAFNPSSITNVVIPPGATMSVNYWNGTAWVPLPGAQGLTDADSPWSYSFPPPDPADVGGLQFTFTSPDGFDPGDTVQPNIVMNYDPTNASDDELPLAFENCSGASSSTDEGLSSDSAPACDSVNVLDPEDPDNGGGDIIEKEWLDTDVGARTHGEVDAQLQWSTGGYSNADSVTLTDAPNPDPDTVETSVYDAFDLVSINAINSGLDPLIEYDAIDAVLLYNGDTETWEAPANSPCDALVNDVALSACVGGLPEIQLTAEEQATTLSVQIVFIENPDRGDSTDPLAPPEGSGVARSVGNDRHVDLTFRIRDDRRSDGSAVTTDQVYNAVDEGVVRNTVNAYADFTDREDINQDAFDDIVIVYVPFDTSLTKDWTGGPVGIPPTGTPQGEYPTTRVTVAATNDSAAYADSMRIDDPQGLVLDPLLSPGEYFNLYGFVSITPPEFFDTSIPADGEGDGTTTVTVTRSVGGNLVGDIATALTWDAADLQDAIGASIEFNGRIVPGSTGTVVADFQLRAEQRTSGEAIDQDDAGTVVNNVAYTELEDAGLDDSQASPPDATAAASIELAEFTIGMTVEKGFAATAGDAPAQSGFSQTEPDDAEFIMTLTGYPIEGARATQMEVRDVDPTFWNAYEFVGFDPSFEFASPIDRVQVGAVTGGTFTGDLGGDLTVTGQTAQTGTPATSPQLPATVDDPAQIQGLVITYTRADGAAWENSQQPRQEIPIIVKRRDVMLTGEAPPTDLPGNESAPGEDNAGVSVNTIDGTVTSYLSAEAGSPITAEAPEVDADVTYAHSPTAVTVTKSPSGTQSPGVPVPYTLTFTNDGPTTVTNPVFVDTLPYDEDGAILLLNPNDAVAGVSPYDFALTGPDPEPAEGDPLPTDVAEVTVTEDIGGEPPTITFAFEDGTALAVGQTYTITIDMIVRPGFPTSTDIDNSASMSGDRPIDSCNGEAQVPPAESCEGATTIDLSAGGAIRSGKLVKADDDELGVVSVVPGYTCTPNADGFYAPPCVPITKPGGTETWRLQLQNTGTVPITRLVAIDVMPTPGDTGAINPAQRGSEWTPIPTNPYVDSTGPGGADLQMFGTTDPDPCVDDLYAAIDACPEGTWFPIEDFADDPSVLTALKSEVLFAADAPLEPGGLVTVDVRSQTPLSSPTDGPDTIAWNTVATGGTTSTGTEILPTEGTKVGVALATGPLDIVKTTSGDGAAAWAPDEFTVQVLCTAGDDDEVVYDEVLTVEADEQVRIDDLPWGSTCVLTEDEGVNGEWDSESSEVTIGRDTDPVPLATLENTYELASITVSKAVIGTGPSGTDPADAGPFPVLVQCTYLGEQIFAPGYSSSAPMAALLRDGEDVTFAGLPAGAECTVRELTSLGSVATTVTTTTATEGPTTETGLATELSLTPDADDDSTTNTVDFVNQYALGNVTVNKIVDGPGSDEFGAGPFTVHMTCVFERTFPLADITTFDDDIVLGGSQPLSSTIEGIPVGSVCSLEETDTAGADTYYFGDAEGTLSAEVIVTDEDGGVEVNATNYFETLVSLDITKIVDESAQDAAGAVPDLGPFPVEVECVYKPETPYEREVVADGYEAGVPMENELVNEQVWTLEGLPTGTTCTATETDTDGAQSTTTTAENADGETTSDSTQISLDLTEDGLLGGTTNHIVFENTFAVGSLSLAKMTDGPGAPELGDGPFVFHIECERLLPLPVTFTYSGDVTLGGDGPLTQTIDGIVAGSLCVITETDDAGAQYVEFTPGEAGSGQATVLVADGETVEVTATNHFEELASLEVTKTITDSVQAADGSAPELGPFPILVQCQYGEGTPYAQQVYADGYGALRPMRALLDDGETVVFSGLPATSECTVTEVTTGGAQSTTVTITTADAGPTTTDGSTAEVVLTPDDPGTTNSAIVANTFAAGELEIVKELDGDGAASLGAGPFTFHVECVYTRDVLGDVVTYSADVTLGGDDPLEVTIGSIVAGSLCTVTETDDGGATSTSFAPGGGAADEGATVTIGADAAVTVTATNIFELSPESGTAGEGDGVLPWTGFTGWAMAVAALVMLILGAALALIRRRLHRE